MANGDFNQTFQGLLGNPAFTTGIGLLSGALDRRPVGETLGGGVQFGLGAAGQAARNDLLRQKMRQEAAQTEALQRQQAAQKQLTGLLLESDLPPDQAELVGLLGQVAPGATAQGLLGQMFPSERADPSIIRSLHAIGVDPQSEEGRELVIGTLRGDDTSALLKTIQAQQAGLQAQLTQERIEKSRADREAARETEQQTRAREQFTVSRTLGNVTEMSQLVDALEGTALETGVGLEDLRRSGFGALIAGKEILGMDASEQRRLAAAHDRLTTLATGTAIENIEVLRGTGSISDRKFQSLLNVFTNPASAPEAIRRSLADVQEAALQTADSRGFSVENRGQVEAQIKRLRGQEPDAPAESSFDSLLEDLAGPTRQRRPPPAAGGGALSPAEQSELEQLRRSQGGL